MFQLLPVVETILLPFLPVEMWATILRLLDSKSLLARARSYKQWISVCQQDPILRRRIHLTLEEEACLAKKFMMDPRMIVRVLRKTRAMKYKTNIQKVFKPAAQDFPKLNFCDSKKKKAKNLLKCKSRSRFCPYRL